MIEVHAKPMGCKLTHRSMERETHGRGTQLTLELGSNVADTPYRKLILRCEFGRLPIEKHKEDIVPELHRESHSKRNNCGFGVTLSWPLTPQSPFHLDRPVFSTVHSTHNHDVWPEAVKYQADKLTLAERRWIREMAVLDSKAPIKYFMNV